MFHIEIPFERPREGETACLRFKSLTLNKVKLTYLASCLELSAAVDTSKNLKLYAFSYFCVNCIAFLH